MAAVLALATVFAGFAAASPLPAPIVPALTGREPSDNIAAILRDFKGQVAAVRADLQKIQREGKQVPASLVIPHIKKLCDIIRGIKIRLTIIADIDIHLILLVYISIQACGQLLIEIILDIVLCIKIIKLIVIDIDPCDNLIYILDELLHDLISFLCGIVHGLLGLLGGIINVNIHLVIEVGLNITVNLLRGSA